ncbi:MAG: hypothetical protein ABEI78_01905 [Candidatus Nanohaloarchaea archaeon]
MNEIDSDKLIEVVENCIESDMKISVNSKVNNRDIPYGVAVDYMKGIFNQEVKEHPNKHEFQRNDERRLTYLPHYTAFQPSKQEIQVQKDSSNNLIFILIRTEGEWDKKSRTTTADIFFRIEIEAETDKAFKKTKNNLKDRVENLDIIEVNKG